MVWKTWNDKTDFSKWPADHLVAERERLLRLAGAAVYEGRLDVVREVNEHARTIRAQMDARGISPR